MAVALIMAIYLGNLIKAFVDDLVMTILELVTEIEGTWENIQVGPFRLGHFIGNLITFIIVAIIVFLLVKITKRWELE